MSRLTCSALRTSGVERGAGEVGFLLGPLVADVVVAASAPRHVVVREPLLGGREVPIDQPLSGRREVVEDVLLVHETHPTDRQVGMPVTRPPLNRRCDGRRRRCVEHLVTWSGSSRRPRRSPRRRADSTSSAACSRVRMANVAWMPVSRTCRSRPSRRCSTSIRSAPPSANTDSSRASAAGPVVDAGEDRQPPARLVLPPADQTGHEPEVDVAARHHDAGHAVVGRPRRAPAISAATPTAPAPSATSLARSISSTIASAMASSPTVTISSTHVAIERTGDLAGVLHGDAVGQRQHRTVGDRVAAVRRAHARLDTDRPGRGAAPT